MNPLAPVTTTRRPASSGCMASPCDDDLAGLRSRRPSDYAATRREAKKFFITRAHHR
jgi:hypothetical protein